MCPYFYILLFRTYIKCCGLLQAIPVVIAALDISTWNLLAIKYALKEEISPTLKIALESMLEDMTARGASEEVSKILAVYNLHAQTYCTDQKKKMLCRRF